MNPYTYQLYRAGVSLWLDNITRSMLDNGTLERYIKEYSITGLTSNPSIFDQAIAHTNYYDQAIATKRKAGLSAEELFFELAIDDLTRAADLFLPIYERSNGLDGWVSLEVSPLLAYDTKTTLAEAKRLFSQANRPNLFIKIPGTDQGIAAIEEAIFSGVPVNVTLLFSAEQYWQAAQAWLRGVERRIEAGLKPDVRSVASIFISRWDKATLGKVSENLRDQLGLAVAKRTYLTYLKFLSSDRVLRVMNFGVQPQRLLWASTGTKDPQASDIFYISNLVAPYTINTMPEETLQAFGEHGKLGSPLMSNTIDPDGTFAYFEKVGFKYEDLAETLQTEGATGFVKSWNDLLNSITAKETK